MYESKAGGGGGILRSSLQTSQTRQRGQGHHIIWIPEIDPIFFPPPTSMLPDSHRFQKMSKLGHRTPFVCLAHATRTNAYGRAPRRLPAFAVSNSHRSQIAPFCKPVANLSSLTMTVALIAMKVATIPQLQLKSLNHNDELFISLSVPTRPRYASRRSVEGCLVLGEPRLLISQ